LFGLRKGDLHQKRQRLADQDNPATGNQQQPATSNWQPRVIEFEAGNLINQRQPQFET